MSCLYGIGVGASGSSALDARSRVDGGIVAIAERLIGIGRVVGQSRRYENPAWGGVTRAPFVNAAVVVDVPWTSTTLLTELFAIERRFGRVRGQKNAARALDLDVLWSSSPSMSSMSSTASMSSSSSSSLTPIVPHPRLRGRAFALVPLVEALQQVDGFVVDHGLVVSANAHGLAPLRAMG